jgi:hypothetical protein
MRELKVTLITPQEMRLQNTQLPDDMKVSEVIAELKDQLNLPEFDEQGEGISYSLNIENRGEILQLGKTLREGGVEEGDTLRLTSSQRLAPSEELPPGGLVSQTRPGDQEIEVTLSVLDLNRTEQTRLPLDKQVSEIIKQIAAQHPLLQQSQNGELSNYRLQSKDRGRFLRADETLREAGVPQLDRLTLHKYEKPGADLWQTTVALYV